MWEVEGAVCRAFGTGQGDRLRGGSGVSSGAVTSSSLLVWVRLVCGLRGGDRDVGRSKAWSPVEG